MKILLAEDSRTSQQLAVFLLEDAGHSVEVANNGLEAVELSVGESFDLILMDVQMPELDGFEATAQIRQRDQAADTRTLIIAMTAQDNPGDRERCLDADMDDYVSKPLNVDELSAALARHSSKTVSKAKACPSVESQSPATPPTESLIDWNAALKSVNGHQAILDSMIAAVLDEAPKLLDQLRQAIDTSDSDVIHRASHTIKGAFRSFQPTQLISVAGQIESLASSAPSEQILPLYRQLEEQLDLVLAEIRQSASTDGPPPLDGRGEHH